MRLADFVGIDELMRRQRDHRLRIGGPERPGAVQHVGEFHRHAARADGAIDEQLVLVTGIGDVLGQRAFHEGAKLRELLLAQRHARGHGVAAALHQQFLLHRLPHRLAEIDARDRAARAGADAARLQRNRKGGTRKLLLQPRGNQTDDAGMPALGGGHDHSALVFEPERRQRLGFGLRLRRLLDDAALAVEPVEFGRDPRGLRDVAFQQQPHAEIGAPDPAARIDARPQHEAEMPGFGRAVQPRHVHQRGMADMVAAAHRDQPLGDEGAVEPGQRRDIGHGAERHMVQHAEQIRLGPFGCPEAAAAQFPVHRHQRDQHQADGGEMAEAGEIVRPVRVHQRIDLGQFVAGLVMVDDDDRHAELARLRQRLEAGGAAIDGDEQRRALGGKPPHRLDVGPVAFEDAVGNVDQADRARNGADARPAAPPRSRHRRRNRRRSRPSRRARPRRQCASPPSPSPSRCGDRASVCGWSDRENPRPRRSRHRGPPARAPASPATGSAA